jgi:broad specificity phosphatase PhoE
MQFIAVRHASTVSNERELINGQIDEGLSAKGLKQMPELIKNLADYQFDVVYVSTMKRSVQTGRPIAAHYDVPLKQDSRIIEVGLGSFEGKGWDSTTPKFGMNSSGMLSSCDYDFRPYGGESSEQVRTRVQSFLDDLKKEAGRTPLVIAHGGVLRWFHYLCTGKKAGRIPNLSVFEFKL